MGTTSITPSTDAAERVLEIAAFTVPNAVRVLGGVHATFMYKQILSEAPHIDVIVRGEGEEIAVELFSAIAQGRWPRDRADIKGLASSEFDKIIATSAADTVKDMSTLVPDWGVLDWNLYTHTLLGTRVAIPNLARGGPFTCLFRSQWKFWRDYRIRDPKDVVDEIEDLHVNHGVGFFILADEEPTIDRNKFIEFCQALIDHGLPDKVKWGVNTRVTEAAAQMKLDRFKKETEW